MKTSILAALCCTLLLAVQDSCSASVYNTTPVLRPATNSSLQHHLQVGQRPTVCTLQDKLFSREHVRVKRDSLWSKKVIEEVKTFSTDGKAKITAVKVLDQKINGHNGYARLVSGGPGFTYVTLRFDSQEGHGIDFIVEVYGKY